MARREDQTGRAELRAVRNRGAGLFGWVFLFSLFVNLLMLTGPLYMLQVYDRVLGSRSEETLVALSILAAGLFLAMAVLDHLRGRLLHRISARFQTGLDQRVFQAAIRRMILRPDDPQVHSAQHDLAAIQRFLASSALIALCDLPWTPVFIVAIFVFHPVLGWLALAGGGILTVIALLNHGLSRPLQRRAQTTGRVADRMVDTLKSEAETIQALGMQGAAYQRWQIVRREALCDAIQASDTGSFWAAASHGIRFLLQSAILGVGAWLTLKGELTPGAMIAGSILLGRALAPVETAVGQWPAVQGALEGWQRLAILLSLHPAGEPRTPLPRPRPLLEVQHLSVIPPGAAQPTLRMVSFQLTPGQAIGVIGPSGAGKSSLARALTGVWPVAGGSIRLDGATPDQYGPDTFGSYFGYLPQRVTLFDGTIAENIARLAVNPDTTAIVDAARRAAAHDMILQLPLGYDTPVSALGGRLSGGQVQRIGLARALFGNPVILILDEPNSNLDNDGTTALNHAIRTMKRAGGAVLIMAHRPAAIQECDLLLVLENGARRAFGPRDQILRDRVTNHSDLVRQTGARGAASLWEAP